jgi:hypothetical protein
MVDEPSKTLGIRTLQQILINQVMIMHILNQKFTGGGLKEQVNKEMADTRKLIAEFNKISPA